MGGFIDLKGFKRDKIEVLERDTKKGNKQGVLWICKCECGQIFKTTGTRIRAGEVKSCGSSQHKADYRWKGYGEISGTYWLQIKHRCIAKDREFSITIEEAWKLFLKQNRRCALTGRILSFVTDYSSNCKEQSASLDRIDSNIGYTKDNCCWIHKTVNKMKHTVHSDEFMQTCKEVVDYQAKLAIIDIESDYEI